MSRRWLESDDAAEHVGYDRTQLDAFYKWVARSGVKPGHRGRRLVFREADLDAALEDDPFVARALTIAAGGKR